MPMSRRATDHDSRERLMRAGLSIARKKGIKALTVRAVAAQAEANLGTFVYHYGTREAFVDELIERWYAPTFKQLRLVASQDDDALAGLRRTMLQLVAWVVGNRAFLAQLLADAGAGEGGAKRFLRSMDTRHPALLLGLIGRAQQARQLCAGDPRHQMMFLMSTLAAPVLMFHLLGKSGLAPPSLAQALQPFTTDPALIEARLDWALKGLAP